MIAPAIDASAPRSAIAGVLECVSPSVVVDGVAQDDAPAVATQGDATSVAIQDFSLIEVVQDAPPVEVTQRDVPPPF